MVGFGAGGGGGGGGGAEVCGGGGGAAELCEGAGAGAGEGLGLADEEGLGAALEDGWTLGAGATLIGAGAAEDGDAAGVEALERLVEFWRAMQRFLRLLLVTSRGTSGSMGTGAAMGAGSAERALANCAWRRETSTRGVTRPLVERTRDAIKTAAKYIVFKGKCVQVWKGKVFHKKEGRVGFGRLVRNLYKRLAGLRKSSKTAVN